MRSDAEGRRNGMSEMVADVADLVDECEVAEGEPPAAVDTFEAVVVAAGNERLQRKLVGR